MRRILVLSGLAAVGFGHPVAAAAHGPCRCTWPAVVSPGGMLRTASGFKVIWNPGPADFADQTTPAAMASGHRSDAPTSPLLQGSRKQPRRRMRLRVPRATPPGIYLVLVFDGSEGGAHTRTGGARRPTQTQFRRTRPHGEPPHRTTRPEPPAARP